MKRSIDLFATAGERRRAGSLVTRLLAAGYYVSVCDGEEWTVKQSRDKAEIMAALATTGEDIIKARHPYTEQREDGKHIRPLAASFYLVWGNASDGSELVANHSDNEIARQFA